MSGAEAERAFLAIADVSGYTSYLAGVELDHAQDILSDLTVTVVEAMAPFQLLKLEGDAAFAYVPAESIDGSVLQDCIEGTYIRGTFRDAEPCAPELTLDPVDLLLHDGDGTLPGVRIDPESLRAFLAKHPGATRSMVQREFGVVKNTAASALERGVEDGWVVSTMGERKTLRYSLKTTPSSTDQ